MAVNLAFVVVVVLFSPFLPPCVSLLLMFGRLYWIGSYQF